MTRTLATAALLVVLLSSTAAGQVACGVRDDIVGQLGRQYGEGRVAVGLESRGRVIEVLASDRGTWSIIVTMPNGTSCLIAAGKSWRNLTKVALAPEL